ncbi:MAG: ribonuclease H-like domain-containing protein, partial [Nitriliruptoraceae bacterium]
AYLWGALVTDRAGTGVVTPGYHPAVVWDGDTDAGGAAAFDAFWTWLTDLRRACDDAGASLRLYCWHQQAEVGCLRDGARLLLAAGGPDRVLEVEALVASDHWVDLKLVWARQVVTGGGNGLKRIATGLGFAWRDEDPGGAQSVVWWDHAVDPRRSEDERQRWRDRILTYNHDDVLATLHVRDWLAREGPALGPPPVPGPAPAGRGWRPPGPVHARSRAARAPPGERGAWHRATARPGPRPAPRPSSPACTASRCRSRWTACAPSTSTRWRTATA